MNLWEIITGNSTLPVDGVVTFWQHLTNQRLPNDFHARDTYAVRQAGTIAIVQELEVP